MHIIWALINVSAFIALAYLLFRYTSLINKRVGIIPALLFILGIVNMLSSVTPTKSTSDVITINEADTTGLSIQSKNIPLSDNKLSRILLNITYQYDLSKTNINVLGAYTSPSGLVAGTKWESNLINISKKDKNTFTYYVSGSYNWSILGISIYKQTKYFEQDFRL